MEASRLQLRVYCNCFIMYTTGDIYNKIYVYKLNKWLLIIEYSASNKFKKNNNIAVRQLNCYNYNKAIYVIAHVSFILLNASFFFLL